MMTTEYNKSVLPLNDIKNYLIDSEYDEDDLDTRDSVIIKPCMKTDKKLRIHINDLYDVITGCENLTLHEYFDNASDAVYKGYIDIDKKLKSGENREAYDNEYKTNIINCFDYLVDTKKINDFIITKASRADKVSYHIYFLLHHGFYFEDPKDIIYFIDDNADIFKKYNLYDSIDRQVYKKNGSIRLPYVYKDDPKTNTIINDSMSYILDPNDYNIIEKLDPTNEYHRDLFDKCVVSFPALYDNEEITTFKPNISKVVKSDIKKPMPKYKIKENNDDIFSDTDTDDEEDNLEFIDEITKDTKSKKNHEEMTKLLNCFLNDNNEHNINHADWQKICWIAANEEYPLKELIKFTNKHETYKSDDYETEREYNVGLENKELPNRAKIGTLVKMVSEYPKQYVRDNYAILYNIKSSKKNKPAIKLSTELKTEMPEEKLLTSPMTEADFSDYFNTAPSFGENYKFLITDEKNLSGLLYYFNGNYWVKSPTINIYNDLDKIYFKLSNMLANNERLSHIRDNVKQYSEITKTLLKLRRTSSKKAIWMEIRNRIAISKNIFDEQTDLLAFENGVYELNTGIFRQGRKDDYVSMTVGYDYDDSITSKRAMDFINMIMPHEDERDFMMKILSTGLEGLTLQKFIVFSGAGGNGKDSLIKLVKSTLGGYFYKANNSAITQKLKGDMSPNIANMDKKRLVLYNEPESGNDGGKIQCSIMKALTGGDSIEYRSLYSTNTNTILHGTHIMCCNDKPPLTEYNEAIIRRLIVIPFRTIFRTKKQIEEQKLQNEYLKEADRFYETPEFMEQYKQSMMCALLEYYKLYLSDNKQLSPPKSCQDLAKEYMEESDEFLCWFRDNYEIGTPDDYTTIQNIFITFKDSDFYKALTKNIQRQKTKKNMLAEIQKNPTLKIYYKAEIDKRINGERIHARSVLTNWRKIVGADTNE